MATSCVWKVWIGQEGHWFFFGGWGWGTLQKKKGTFMNKKSSFIIFFFILIQRKLNKTKTAKPYCFQCQFNIHNRGFYSWFLKSLFILMSIAAFICRPLRMYCIDRVGVPESHDGHAFYCLYDYCVLAKVS